MCTRQQVAWGVLLLPAGQSQPGLVPADCRMTLACGVLLCCRYDGVMDGPMGPAVSATLGQMLDDFFQYAAELQQSLEQQGALHGCSAGQQDYPAQQLTAPLEQRMCLLLSTHLPLLLDVFVLCRCVQRRQQQQLVAAGKRRWQQQQHRGGHDRQLVTVVQLVATQEGSSSSNKPW